MTLTPLYIVTFLYACQGALWMYEGKHADVLIVGGYVIANVGLIVKAGMA